MVSLTFLWSVWNGLLTGTWHWTLWNTDLIWCSSSYIFFSILLIISIIQLAKALFNLSSVASKVNLNRVKKASMGLLNQSPRTVARTVWPSYGWNAVLQKHWNDTISLSYRDSHIEEFFVTHVSDSTESGYLNDRWMLLISFWLLQKISCGY